jgi:hypothetical protein
MLFSQHTRNIHTSLLQLSTGKAILELLLLGKVVQCLDVRRTQTGTHRTSEGPHGHPPDGMPFATPLGGWLARLSALPSAGGLTATPTAGRSGRPHPSHWTERPTNGRNGLPLEPTAAWSGRPLANGHHERADGQTCPTNVFRTRFSQKTFKVTTMLLSGPQAG